MASNTSTKKHSHGSSGGSLQLGQYTMKIISEEQGWSDEELLAPANQCPSKDEVQAILSNNDFQNASDIADDYKEYIDNEEWDKEQLLNDLRDPDGSWLADNELKVIYSWTDEQATKFKQLVLKLIVESQTRLNVKTKHRSVMKSLLQKTKSTAFMGALQKSTKQEAAQTASDPLAAMPTYINRAIWFRSDDENLERLVDRAVKEVVQLESIWNEDAFVKNIYSDDTFGISVEKIFELKFHFFDRFVKERYKRQLQLYDLFDESDDSKSDDTEENDAHSRSPTVTEDHYNYVAYYVKKPLDDERKEEKEDINTQDDGAESKDEVMENQTKKPKDDNDYVYHIFPKSREAEIERINKDKHSDIKYQEICKLNIEESKKDNDPYEWVWWRRKTKGEVANKAKQNGIKTYGWWDLLNNPKSKKKNVDFNGVSTPHLNIIFALLRHYYKRSIKMEAVVAKTMRNQNKTIHMQMEEIKEEDPTMLDVVYCQGEEFIPVQFEVDIFIHDDDKEEEKDESKEENDTYLYELTWWNGKKKTECNAIAIKNKTATLVNSAEIKVDAKAIKEKYYMRISTNHNQKNIEWEWYDNDRACYEDFKDYVELADKNAYKDQLLHKQLEAIFQSNIDTNYPWKFFDRLDANVPKNCHSFNNAQITHLRPALEENELHFNTAGYLVRFVRLHAPKNVESEFDINTILNMEQIAVTNEATTFSRNIRRMIDGKNSLSLIYANSNVFINSWLQNYLLSSKAQRLYFWSFILCIATKIKQIDIEIENQLVTVPQYEAFLSAKKQDALAFDGGEVRDEQNDVVLYPGFLVPPILDGETATDQEGALSKNTVQGFKKKINNLSKTRILRKAMVQRTLKMNKDEECDKYLWYQTSEGEQYRDSIGVMLRFGELIRKFILEKKHLADDTSLWPYYKNYFHRNDHQSYHTLINRFNLSLMFSRDDMFDLLEKKSIIDTNAANEGCFSHFSCAAYDPEAEQEVMESARMRSKEVAIRHQRKVAAQLLLQKWDSLRNLNILRHQLGPLLNVVMEDAQVEKEEFDETLQKRLIKVAKEYDMAKWRELIQIANKRLQNNLNNIETGWQLLSEYDIHRVDSMEISIPKYPFFESFMIHFLLNYLNKERKDVQAHLGRTATEQSWYPKFKQSWTITPEWWLPNHDIILMELALKHGDAWHKYGRELQGDNASNYMMRLRSVEDDADDDAKSKPKSRRTKSRPYVHGHTLRSVSASDLRDGLKPNSEEIQDELRPYLEFQHWCRQKSNMLHRLKYITNTLILTLSGITPSLIEIRIPHDKDQPQFSSQSHIFSEYERVKHLEYVQRETKLPEVTDDTMKWTLKHARGRFGSGADVDVKGALSTASPSRTSTKKLTTKHHTEVSLGLSGISKMYSEAFVEKTSTPKSGGKIKKTVSFTADSKEGGSAAVSPVLSSKKESTVIVRYKTDLDEEDADNDDDDDVSVKAVDEEQYWSDEDKTEMRIHDPFIHRNFLAELEEVIHSFNMIKYGPYMARFIINEIREYNMPELWDALAVVMEAIPFPMGLYILKEQMGNLRRSKPEKLFQVCKEMVDGTNFGVAAALRMAQYFRKVSKADSFQEAVWIEKSIGFEKKAHELINDIESDHLLYILLTIPLYDTTESMSILSLALEEKRVSFLNNDRILGIMKHVWYHSAAIHVEEEIEPRDFGWGESLQILFFQPFKFYMSPVGFNWTIAVFYLLYLLFVVLWSYAVVKGKDPEAVWMTFWFCNAGFVAYELSEFSDKGRQYFSVTGIMNVWDIIISIIWIALFVLFVGERARQHFVEHDHDAITTTSAPFINGSTADMFATTIATLSTYFTTDFDDIPMSTTPTPTLAPTLEKSPSDFINNFRGNIREIFSFLWAVQLFFVSTRFLTLFQNTKYLGSLLKIVQKMFTEIVKFFSVAIVVVAAYTFGFYFIFGFNLVNINGEEDDPAQDFWPTILFTFDEFIAGGTGEFTDNHVVPFFAIFITVIGFLVLTNMLIALMTTEYEAFQEKAILEIAYMWTETCYDLAHRDRLMPPPLNLIALAIALLTHIVCVFPCAWCCGTTDLNMYTQFGHKTYNNLNSCYCGCNRAHKERILEALPDEESESNNQKLFAQQSRKIYGERFTTFLSFSGWMYFRDIIILKCLKKKLFCCCSKACDDCCIPKKTNADGKKLRKSICYGPKKCFRKCCCDDYDDEAALLTAYHKGCYNCIKLRVKDKIDGQDTTTIRGISMKQYIEQFEEKHKTKLHKEDKILLKHLTVDTLFCDQCYQPYLEKDVNQVLLSPFRVLLDYVSCWVFLFTAWLPLVIFFSVMASFEHCTDSANKSIAAKTETTDKNEYEQFDREYFPQPLHQIIED